MDDENPYRAPQTQGGGRPGRSFFWRLLLELVLLIVVVVVIAVPLSLAAMFVLQQIGIRRNTR